MWLGAKDLPEVERPTRAVTIRVYLQPKHLLLPPQDDAAAFAAAQAIAAREEARERAQQQGGGEADDGEGAVAQE